MKKLTLVILAAGMGSRYGGLKQLDEISLEGDTIIDFSIYDAIEAGFTKIVFVIRNSFKEEFYSMFDSKLNKKIEIVYIFQELDTIPKQFTNLNRTKPWGTGHALLMAKDVIDENFAVINADDFYGKKAFEVMVDKLLSTIKTSTDFYMIGYQLKNTLSEHGSVSRGQCYIDEKGFLKTILERTNIEKINDIIFYKDNNENLIEIEEKTTVSMNFWGFTPKIFVFLEKEFYSFLTTTNTHLKKEFFIPLVIDNIIKNKQANIEVLQCNSKWLGVTYKNDKPFIVKEIKQLKENGLYPKLLW